MTRLLANEGLIENTRLATGNLRESDWEKIAQAASVLNRTNIRIDDNPLLTVADMNAKCRQARRPGIGGYRLLAADEPPPAAAATAARTASRQWRTFPVC
ncbi:MAG: DnaB-like helicase C-terminal domain-containing protein [Oscillospiraceae bacterium]